MPVDGGLVPRRDPGTHTDHVDQTHAEELVRAHVRAFNDRDLDALLRTLADDAVWTTGRTTVRGRAELATFFAGAFAGLEASLEIRTLLSDGRAAAAELTETFGGARAVPIAGFYELAGGRIARARIYREGSADPD